MCTINCDQGPHEKHKVAHLRSESNRRQLDQRWRRFQIEEPKLAKPLRHKRVDLVCGGAESSLAKCSEWGRLVGQVGR